MKKRFGYPRYMINRIKGGKVTGCEWAETLAQARRICGEIEGEGEDVEVRDMTYLDDWSGYNDFLREREKWREWPNAVWCMQTRRAYRNDAAAASATGETIYYIKRSYLMCEPTPRGWIWRKMNY